MRSSTCSTEPMWVKVPRPSSAARVIRKVLGAEPMPTMNTRERPRMALIVSNSCCSLPIAPSVRNTTWRTVLASPPRRSVSAAFIGGTISVPPRASQRRHEGLGLRDMLGVGRDGVGEQHVHGVVEADDVEAVGRLEPAERVEQARLGLHDRGAAHRAGIVDHEDDLARARLLASARSAGGVTKASR